MFARPNSPKLLAQRDITHDGDIYFWTSCIIYVTTVETVQTILTSVVVKTHPPNLAQNPRPTTPPPTQQQPSQPTTTNTISPLPYHIYYNHATILFIIHLFHLSAKLD